MGRGGRQRDRDAVLGLSAKLGTLAGAGITRNFVRLRLPLWARRVITMVPAFVVVALGVNATQALVMSQVILSLVLPLPMLALLWFTSQRELMGSFANGRLMHGAAVAATIVVLGPNALLPAQTAGIEIPGLG